LKSDKESRWTTRIPKPRHSTHQRHFPLSLSLAVASATVSAGNATVAGHRSSGPFSLTFSALSSHCLLIFAPSRSRPSRFLCVSLSRFAFLQLFNFPDRDSAFIISLFFAVRDSGRGTTFSFAFSGASTVNIDLSSLCRVCFCFNNFLFYSTADARGDLIFHVNSLSCLSSTGYCVSG